MKKLLLLLYTGMLLASAASGQSVTNVTILPLNPTSNDSIKVITECTFPNDAYSVFSQVYIDTSTNSITIQLFKCKYSTPPPAVITDTFQLGQLAVASWTLNILLFTTQYDVNTGSCGTYSMTDTDNSTFDINQPGPVTGISSHSPLDQALYPNPAQDIIRINGAAEGMPVLLRIINLQGQTVVARRVEDTLQEVSILQLPPGLYVYTLEAAGKISKGKLIITTK
jgi:hypothetical protein